MGGADQYDLRVMYIPGHNPDLVLKDLVTGQVTERIDLTTFKTSEALHELMADKGILKKAVPGDDTKQEL